MVSIQGGSGGGGGFDYVQDPSPQNPEEGEEWYDTGSDRAFVYDGSTWIEQTIGSHDKLSNVTASQHHSRPTGTQNGGYDRQNVYSESRSSGNDPNSFDVTSAGLSASPADGATFSGTVTDRGGYSGGSTAKLRLTVWFGGEGDYKQTTKSRSLSDTESWYWSHNLSFSLSAVTRMRVEYQSNNNGWGDAIYLQEDDVTVEPDHVLTRNHTHGI